MRDGIDDIVETTEVSPFIANIIEEGKFDNDLLEDSSMFIVDDDIDDNQEAEEDILSAESLSDSDMIDIIDGGNIEDFANDI